MGEQPGHVPPAGWYVDPGSGQQLRWWSGRDWTENLAPLTEHRPEPDTRPHAPTTAAPTPHATTADAPATQATSAQATTPDAAAAADPHAPLTRRERRLLDEQAAATLQLPPPVPRIAPITSYGWDTESAREPVRPMGTPVLVADPVDLYLDIPSRWSSASVWLIAFMPWITGLCLFAALLLEAWEMALWQRWGALALPYLLTLAAAQRDVTRLRIWRHRHTASWAWSLLGAPAYLIARTVVLRKHAGLGSAPLWVWLVNLLLTAGAGVYLVTVAGMYLVTEGYITL